MKINEKVAEGTSAKLKSRGRKKSVHVKISTYARQNNCTTAYIYALVWKGLIVPYLLDSNHYIDTVTYPSIAMFRKRKEAKRKEQA